MVDLVLFLSSPCICEDVFFFIQAFVSLFLQLFLHKCAKCTVIKKM